MIKVGVLGTAKIAREQVIPAIQNSEYCRVTAIASRDKPKAQKIADKWGMTQCYDSYEKLLADPTIDLIYNPLPNHLHVPWSISALKSGKHVLCEKPLGLSEADVQLLVNEAKKHEHLKIMEGFMYKYHPQWIKAIQMVEQGELGDIQSIKSLFSYALKDTQNIRNKPEWGGGGLLDIGCYPVSLSRLILAKEPTRVFGNQRLHPEWGVDTLFEGVLEFEEVISTFTCATMIEPKQQVKIFGTQGTLELTIPFNPPLDKPTLLKLTQQGTTGEIQIPPSNQFTLMFDDLAESIMENTPTRYSLEDSLQNIQVLDALKKSAEQNKTISLL